MFSKHSKFSTMLLRILSKIKLSNQNTLIMNEKKTPYKKSSEENNGYLKLDTFPYVWDGPINILVDMY